MGKSLTVFLIILSISLVVIVLTSSLFNRNYNIKFKEGAGYNVAIGENTGWSWSNESYYIEINCKSVFNQDFSNKEVIDLAKKVCRIFYDKQGEIKQESKSLKALSKAKEEEHDLQS